MRKRLSPFIAIFLVMVITLVTVFFATQGRAGNAKAAINSQTSSTSDPILLIHGFNGNSNSTDCNADWGTAKAFIQSSSLPGIRWTGPVVEVGYYSQDTNCTDGNGQNVNLSTLHSDWRTHCIKYDGTKESVVGTNGESIRHLACEFAWYIYDTYTQYGTNVRIGAYSMGGLITRYAIYAVHNQLSSFPSSLDISHVVDFDTPNGGATFLPGSTATPHPFLLCNLSCLQFKQMRPGSAFINELNTQAQNPQASMGTSWTLLGSKYNLLTCDFLHASTSLYMDSDYKILYNSPCYPHTGSNDMLQDNSLSLDASVAYCNGCTK